MKLLAKTLKVTTVLEPSAFVGLVVPNGQSKFPGSWGCLAEPKSKAIGG